MRLCGSLLIGFALILSAQLCCTQNPKAAPCNVYPASPPASPAQLSCAPLLRAFEFLRNDHNKRATETFRAISKHYGNDPWIDAQVHRGLGEALTGLGEFAKAKPELESALKSLQDLDDAV